MALTPEEETKMFGATIAEFTQFIVKGDTRSQQMAAMSILSDIQAEIEFGSYTEEGIRQALNRSKYLMSEVMTKIPR